MNRRIDLLLVYIERELAHNRIPCYQVKTKYGQVRAYVQLYWRCLLNVTHPQHMDYHSSGYPRWLVKLDIYWISRIGFNPWVEKLTHALLRKRYRRVYENAIRSFPEHKYTLINGADYPEYLTGLR